MQKLFSSIILIFSFLFQPQTQAGNLAPNILILGDSLSAAYNIPVTQSWPALFSNNIRAHHPETRVTNASISGETTFGGAKRLPQLLESIQPSHLIVELGGNDGLRGLKFAQSRENLNRMITLARAKNISVLLIGVDLPPNLGPAYNQRFQQIFESLSATHDIDYLAHFLGGVAADKPEYMQTDGIHPTALAQPILAEKVLAVMLAMLGKKLQRLLPIGW
ncbi:MAG: arylesterase [Gammaproteobacteria bacterium]|nr:arylesterase [Gammaproteobacteria bacterium]